MNTTVRERDTSGEPMVIALESQNKDEDYIVQRFHVLLHLNHDPEHLIHSRHLHPYGKEASQDGRPIVYLEFRNFEILCPVCAKKV